MEKEEQPRDESLPQKGVNEHTCGCKDSHFQFLSQTRRIQGQQQLHPQNRIEKEPHILTQPDRLPAIEHRRRLLPEEIEQAAIVFGHF